MGPRCRAAALLLLAVVLCSTADAASGRRSLQQDALSNSNGCIASGVIPKCESGACATRNIMGVARWTCLRCLTNYEPVVDASGQDNIIQCVCSRGTYENGSNATSCTKCPANSFCPGGDKVENPTSRGTPSSCGTGLITRTEGARSAIDCVAPAGYAQTSPNTATPCATSEYAPMFNRLAKCLRCQSGLAEPPSSGLAFSQRNSKRAVCKIPPGKYVSQGLVRICPQGFYRENWVEFDAAVGTICLPCNPGITTDGAGAGSVSLCNKVLPGYGISNVVNVTGPADIPALPQSNTTGLPNATLCDIGFYSLGGRCAQCPGGTVTTVKGAKSIEECVVPPGYYLAAGAMPQCGNGTFREGWVMYSDPKAANCTACGDGIASEPRDLDVHPLAANGTLVRATSASCYIEAGMGMIAQGKNLFVGKDCPANTYGAAGKVYGWAAAPCKPCARNLITDGKTRVNNSDVCINDDGFGYASEGASRCAPGFYSAKGSRKPCQQCPVGRTTADNATMQRLFTDCYVQPGFGIVSSTGNSSDGTGFLFDALNMTDAQAAVLPVLQCPIGYYGGGMSLRAACTKCPVGSTTPEAGAVNATQCSICIPGWGKQGASVTAATPCTPCARGTYHPGGSTVCTACPNPTFYAPVDGAGATWTSNGTTMFTGSIGEEFCVPSESQLSPDAGQAYFSAQMLPLLTTGTPAASLAACIATCAPNKGCLVQWDAAAQVCYYAALDYDDSGSIGTKLKYKLPPATLGSASSVTNASNNEPPTAVKAKTMASGFYGRLALPSASLSSWLQAGVPLEPTRAQNFKWGAGSGSSLWDHVASEGDCQKKCDDSVVCVFFIFDTASSSCLYRGGEDALRTRSFFVLPSNASVPMAGNSATTGGSGSSSGSGGSGTISGNGTTSGNGTSNSQLPTTPAPNCTNCVVPNDVSTVIFPNGSTTTPNVDACAAKCPKNSCCLFQFTVTYQQCRTTALDDDDGTTGNKYHITYKRGSDWRGSLMSTLVTNGNFWRCKISKASIPTWLTVGSSLDAATASTYVATPEWDTSVNNDSQCRKKCNDSSLCFGFIWDADQKACSYKAVQGQDSVWSSYFY